MVYVDWITSMGRLGRRLYFPTTSLYSRDKSGSTGGGSIREMKASDMVVLTNMLSKIISDIDDVKAMVRKSTFEEWLEEGSGDE